MTTNEYVRAFAGAFVLISLALGVEAVAVAEEGPRLRAASWARTR